MTEACPHCGAKYKWWQIKCASCGKSLLTQPEREHKQSTGELAWCLFVFSAMAAILAGIIVYEIRSLPELRSQMTVYAKSPGCVSTTLVDPRLPGCSDETLAVSSKLDKGDLPGLEVSVKLGVVDPTTGGTDEVSLTDRRVFDRVSVGDHLVSQTWKGNICSITGKGAVSYTADYPSAALTEAKKHIGETIFGLACIIAGIVALVRQLRQRYRAWRNRDAIPKSA
jgi:hypothetical protein